MGKGNLNEGAEKKGGNNPPPRTPAPPITPRPRPVQPPPNTNRQ